MSSVFPERYKDKVVLVTGGGTGIGAAISHRLAQEGAAVALCGRRAHLVEAKAQALREQGLQAVAIPSDISTQATQIVRSTVEHFGQLDVLINNAAISAGVGVEEMVMEDWRQVMSVNLDAVFEMVHHALPHLLATKGNILHISSIGAVAGEFDDAAYAASKAGLEGFSRKIALELAGMGVRSNVIRPGLIMTEAFANMPQDFFEAQIPMIPLGMMGEPDDIAHAAAYLCSNDARFITGIVLTVDGGESAK